MRSNAFLLVAGATLAGGVGSAPFGAKTPETGQGLEQDAIGKRRANSRLTGG